MKLIHHLIKDYYTGLIPLLFSLIGLIASFIFFGMLSSKSIVLLGQFSFLHSSGLILSHIFRFGADFDILKSKEKLESEYGSADIIVNYIFTVCTLSLFFFLILGSVFFHEYPSFFYIVFVAIFMTYNLVLANFLRTKGFINIYSLTINLPFVIATVFTLFTPTLNSFSGISYFLISLFVITVFQIFIIKNKINFIFFRTIDFNNLKKIVKNLYPIFVSGLLLLAMSQLPTIIFGILGQFESAAFYKILNKICSILILFSNAFFAFTIPVLSKINLADVKKFEKIYNKRNIQVLTVSLLYLFMIISILPMINNYFKTDITITLLIIFSFGYLFNIIAGPINQIFIISSMQKALMKILFFSSILFSPLCFVLINKFGFLGSVIYFLIFNCFWISLALFKFYKVNMINLFLPIYLIVKGR